MGYERSQRTEVCVRDNPKDLLFGAGAEALRNDVLLTETEASIHQQVDYVRLVLSDFCKNLRDEW